ncbi:hypothetical protein DIPPA_11307 [Diplonema papillatum]|nr:hypothetical protein DIPPA_11307 [Diplonema papillatum]
MGLKSVYLHHDASDRTKRYDLSASRSAEDVLSDFVSGVATGKKEFYKLTADNGSVVGPEEDLYSRSSNGDDYFVEPTDLTFTVTVATDGGATKLELNTRPLKITPETSLQDCLRSICAAHKDIVAPDSKFYDDTGAELPTTLTCSAVARLAMQGKLVIQAGPAEDELALLKKYLGMGAEALEKGSFAGAVRVYSELQRVLPKEVNSAKGLALALMGARKWKKAADAWAHVFELIDPTAVENLSLHVEYADCLIKCGDSKTAIALLSHAVRSLSGKPPIPEGEDLKAQLGYAYLATGDEEGRSAAAALWTAVLKETQQKHVRAMLGYTDLARQLGQNDTAVRGLLNLLVSNANDNEVVAAFGKVMREVPDSVTILTSIVPLTGPEQATAYSFLAVSMKKEGAITPCIALLKLALQADPSNAGYALNLAHAIDVQGKTWESLDVLAGFLRENAAVSVKTKTADGAPYEVSCEQVLKLLEPPLKEKSPDSWLYGESARRFAAQGKVVRWNEEAGIHFAGPETEPQSSIDAMPENLRKKETPGKTAEAEPGKQNASEYTAKELDTLAIFFTVVKELFKTGSLAALPDLVVLLGPLHKDKSLFATFIRNEQAYFCTVAQLLQYTTLPLPSDPPLLDLHVCGDSHSFSTSWHVLAVGGQQYLTRNHLVTGLKCYHLRPESHFYPRYNYEHVTKRLPKKSKIIMMFGEIDCREGIVLAVEKGRYDTVEEGMRTVIEYYVKALLALQKEKDADLYVHPALPVLDVTRPMVCQFNDLLASALAEPRVTRNGRIKYLDFYGKLLSPDKKQLLPQYALDGTHINPKYLDVLQDALTTAFAKPSEGTSA